MRVSICSVGSEVVLGDQVDSNAAWLSQRLREIGVQVRHHLAVGDHHGHIVDALRWLIATNEAVIVGGGLGPTPDDLTREAVAEATGSPLHHRDELEELIRQRFASSGHPMPRSNLRQAQVCEHAVAFEPLGTAPGFRLRVERDDAEPCDLYVLPGVPWEQQGMYERDVLPHLLERAGRGAVVTRVLHITGMGESAIAEAIGPVLKELHGEEGRAVTFLATSDEVQVRVTADGATPDEAKGRAEPLLRELRDRLGDAVAGVDEQSLEQAVGELLRERGETVAFAESATAGACAARMASVPGASGILKGGAVVYATEAKSEVLGVPPELIEEHSPVSEEVTRELAVRVRDVFAADWGVGVTGVAGPGAQGGKPIGTVVWAVAGPDGEVTCRAGEFPGDRRTVQERLVSAALEALRRRLRDR